MEKQDVAWIHFDVNVLHSLKNGLDPFWIRAGLVAGQLVVDAAAMMGTANHLQTSVF